MKNKLYLIALILLTPILILSFYYPAKNTQSPSVPPAPPADKFYYGAIQSAGSYPNYDFFFICNYNYLALFYTNQIVPV